MPGKQSRTQSVSRQTQPELPLDILRKVAAYIAHDCVAGYSRVRLINKLFAEEYVNDQLRCAIRKTFANRKLQLEQKHVQEMARYTAGSVKSLVTYQLHSELVAEKRMEALLWAMVRTFMLYMRRSLALKAALETLRATGPAA
jgi:hypothetical protein